MNWYYESQGKQQGPVSEAQLEQLLAEGRVTQDTLVWREGMENWAPLRSARPEGAAVPPLPAGEGTQCDSCGNFYPPDEVLTIGGRAICANCKPSAVAALQQGGMLPALEEADRTGPAWEHRETLGMPKAAWETIKAVLGAPSETFTRMKRVGGLTAPLLYNVIVGSLAAIVGIMWQVVFEIFGNMAGAQGEAEPGLAIAGGAGFLVAMGVYIVLMPVLMAVTAFVTSGITHLSLMICGGAKRPFETTFRVMNYASASVSVLQVIPACGAVAAAIWGLVASCIGLSRAHEIGTGRALLALLLPTLVCVGLLMFFGMWIYGMWVASQGVST